MKEERGERSALTGRTLVYILPPWGSPTHFAVVKSFLIPDYLGLAKGKVENDGVTACGKLI